MITEITHFTQMHKLQHHFTSLCLVSIFSKVITHFPFKKECRRTAEESTEAE